MDDLLLIGRDVRLEPLGHHHLKALVAASANDAGLYQWSPVPKDEDEAARYIETALSWKQAGTAVPFAIVRVADGVVIGSTRFWNLEHWLWPKNHPRQG